MSITDKIQTVTDAYTYLGVDRSEMTFPEPKNDIQRAANAFVDATILTAALNERREPDFDDLNESKCIIGWDMRSEASGGPGFSYDVSTTFVRSVSPVAACLVFFKLEVAIYAASKFTEVYKTFMTFQASIALHTIG